MKTNPEKYKELTDSYLFQSVKAGDEHALEILFNSYYEVFCVLANKIVRDDLLAEEIVADVFFTIWTKRDSIHIHTNVLGYLQYMTRNLSLNRVKQAVRVYDTLHEHSQIAACDPNPEEKVLSEEAIEAWEEKIKRLPPQRQKVLRMNKFDGLSYREIASYLNLSEKTVRNQVQLAIKSLEYAISSLLITLFLY